MAGMRTAEDRSLCRNELRATDRDVPVFGVDSSLIDLSFALYPLINYTTNEDRRRAGFGGTHTGIPQRNRDNSQRYGMLGHSAHRAQNALLHR